MTKYFLLPAAALLLLSSCSVNTKTATTEDLSDSLASVPVDTADRFPLAKMEMKDTIRVGEALTMKFTVMNKTDNVLRFCKWHTPFEPLVSKYLDIKDEQGVEVAYRGAMARRVMPPPPESYVQLQPGDSLWADVDLLKGYAITKPSRYTITYVGQNMSGLAVKDSISFVYR